MSDYSCFLCSKSITYAGKKKHLFSKSHLPQIHSGMVKRKAALDLWIADFEQGKKSLLDHIPIIPLSNSKSYIVCIPCKHIGEAVKGHQCSLEAMKENVEYYKKVLNQPVIKATRASIETQTDGVPGGGLGVPSDPKEIERLKRELANSEEDNLTLMAQNQEIYDRSQKSEALYKALTYALDYVKEQDPEIFDSIMSNIKEEYAEVLPYLKK